MSDIFPPKKRSWIMSRVRSKNTTPERMVRSLVYRMGYRYRLHRRDLPGIPDLVFSSKKKIIFVNGCFWHGHTCSRGSRQPKQNSKYWQEKIRKNRLRDDDNFVRLHELGWNVIVIWECELSSFEKLREKIATFLGSGNS